MIGETQTITASITDKKVIVTDDLLKGYCYNFSTVNSIPPVIQLKKEITLIEEEFPGRIVANRIAEIRPQVGGIILKRLFKFYNNPFYFFYESIFSFLLPILFYFFNV